MLLIYFTMEDNEKENDLIVPIGIIPYSTDSEIGKSITDELVEVFNVRNEDNDDDEDLNDIPFKVKYSVREITEEEAITFIKELNKIDMDKYL